MKRAFAGLHEQFPDVRVTIESMVAEGDMVAVRLTYSGTDAATGQRVSWPEAVESWEIIDTGRGPDRPVGRHRRRSHLSCPPRVAPTGSPVLGHRRER
jgi:hypothetical protein